MSVFFSLFSNWGFLLLSGVRTFLIKSLRALSWHQPQAMLTLSSLPFPPLPFICQFSEIKIFCPFFNLGFCNWFL